MRKLLTLTAALALAACSRNPDPEYAPPSTADQVGVEAAPEAPAAAEAPAAPAAPEAAPRLSEAETMRLGRETVALLYASDIATLWPRFDAQVQAQAVSADSFQQMMEQVFLQTGAEDAVVDEAVLQPETTPGLSLYRRRSHYLAINQNADLIVAFNADGTIAGINIRPAEE